MNGGVYIPGANPGVLVRLYVWNDSMATAIVNRNGRAQFFRGSPMLPTVASTVFVDQPGLVGSPSYDGVNALHPGQERMPIDTHAQEPQPRVGMRSAEQCRVWTADEMSYGVQQSSGKPQFTSQL